MILRNIGHHSNIIAQSMYSMIEECMWRCLHNKKFTSCHFCSSYKFPNLPRWWSSHFESIFFFDISDNHIHRSKHRDFLPICTQAFRDKITGSSFSFCSGNPYYDHIFCWISRRNIGKPSHKVVPSKSNRRIKGDEFFKFFKHTNFIYLSWILWESPYYSIGKIDFPVQYIEFMQKLKIQTGESNGILRTISDPIKPQEIRQFKSLALDMVKHIKDPKNWGVGLAAPQIWVNKRLIVVSLMRDYDDESFRTIPMINPEIIENSGKKCSDKEGCLSVPWESGSVERWTWVRVNFLDTEWKKYSLKLEDLAARIVQHEIDHLDWILFTDKVVGEIEMAK